MGAIQILVTKVRVIKLSNRIAKVTTYLATSILCRAATPASKSIRRVSRRDSLTRHIASTVRKHGTQPAGTIYPCGEGRLCKLHLLEIAMKSFVRSFGVDSPVVLAAMLALIALVLISLSTPAAAQSADVYSYGQQQQPVQYGMVVGTREVAVSNEHSRTNQVGTMVGATVGGAIGSKLGENAGWQGQAALAAIGAALGGLGGSRIAESSTTQRAVEVLVQIRGTYNPAQIVAIVQPYPGPSLQAGQEVAVLGNGAQTRVIPK
jgi:outer membrane lipoprotein SlyB